MLEAPPPLWDLVAETPWLKIMHLVAVRKCALQATLVLLTPGVEMGLLLRTYLKPLSSPYSRGWAVTWSCSIK